MEDTDDGFHPFKKCPKCGATWCDIPVLELSPISGIWKDAIGIPHYKARKVSLRKKAKK